ncbi:MAG: hypothetical protein ABIG42_08740 [bacterium]
MRLYLFIILVIITTAFWGCSKSDSNPVFVDSFHSSIPDSVSDQSDSLSLFGIYELIIHPDKINAELTPMRTSSIGESYLVSGLNFFINNPCPDCLKLTTIAFDNPYIKLTFDISHPFEPGSMSDPPSATNRRDLNVFDLAMIIVPKESVPTSYSLGDIYADACGNQNGFTTELARLSGDSAACPYFLVIDDSQTGISTDNEFAMGTKNVQFDTWFSDIGRFEIYLTMGYGFSAKRPDRLNPKYYNPEFNRKPAWRVDAIPPQGENPPAIGNTWDDVDTLTPYNVTVKVYDWQIGANVNASLTNITDVYAASEVERVSIEIPGMTTTPIEVTSETSGTGAPNAPLLFTVPIANENALPAGEYTGLVKVDDERIPPNPFYDRDFLIHSASTGVPKEITPLDLNILSKTISIDGNTAYMGGHKERFYIVDISDHDNPKVLKMVPTENYIDSIFATNGYIYLTSSHYLDIFDVDPYESTSLVKSLYLDSNHQNDIFVDNGYAYAAGTGLEIIDIDPPETAYSVNIFDSISYNAVHVVGNYAYAVTSNSLMKIININPPESASLIQSVPISSDGDCIFVQGDYAYITSKLSGLIIVDINPPLSASVVKTLNVPENADDITVSGDYAYTVDTYYGVTVFDINPPETAFIVQTVEFPGKDPIRIDISGTHAYVTGDNCGLSILDITSPASSFVSKIIGHIGFPEETHIVGNYAFVASTSNSMADSWLHIVDMTSLDDTHIINSLQTGGTIFDVSDGYAYIGVGQNLMVVDIDPPEAMSVVKILPIATGGGFTDVLVSGDYAYLTTSPNGVAIVDINPPESSSFIKSVPTLDLSFGMCKQDQYLYVAVSDSDFGLQVIDVSDPSLAEVIKTIDTGSYIGDKVSVAGGYAYVSEYGGGASQLSVVDIDPINSAHIVKTVGLSARSMGSEISGTTLYVSTRTAVDIFDILSPPSMYLANNIWGLYNPMVLDVTGLVFVCDKDFGLRIFTPHIQYNGELLNYAIPEYATYQTFTATVVDAP